MRKLKLEVDELRVVSFETDRGMRNAGTVRGQMPFQIPATDESDCGDVCGGGGGTGYTCKYSCPNSCTDLCTVVDCPTNLSGCCG